jgi:hypothetical protein
MEASSLDIWLTLDAVVSVTDFRKDLTWDSSLRVTWLMPMVRKSEGNAGFSVTECGEELAPSEDSVIGIVPSTESALSTAALAVFRVTRFTVFSKEAKRVTRNMFCTFGGIEGLISDIRPS